MAHVHDPKPDDPKPDNHRHDSGHGHGHGHGHARHHPPPPGGFDAAFAIGSGLNALFVVAQVVAGIMAHSTALLADAVHNLGDVLGLVLAWVAAIMARRSPSPGRTYGWGRSTVLASLINAAVVLLGCGAILVEAAEKLLNPDPVAGGLVMAVAGAGILVNGGSALLFARGRHGDMNVRGAFVHLMGDAAVSAGVVVAAGLVILTGRVWIDPLASVLIVVAVVAGTWRLGRDSVNLALDAVPAGIDAPRLEEALRRVPGVEEVHDLHVWALSTTVSAMTVHLVRQDGGDSDAMVRDACTTARAMGIAHPTVQVETGVLANECRLRPAEVV